MELFPMEWAAKKILGPTFEVIGRDLAQLYAAGRDRILNVAIRKIPAPDDGKRANLRVARDALWNGAFTESTVAAEYYGGLLASSRSEDGTDDTVIPFMQAVASLSSKQLRLHYHILRSLEQLQIETPLEQPTPHGRDTVAYGADPEHTGLDVDVLIHCGLLGRSYEHSVTNVGGTPSVPYLICTPTRFGVILYAAAHNKLEHLNRFGILEFGDFPDVNTPEVYATGRNELFQKILSAG